MLTAVVRLLLLTLVTLAPQLRGQGVFTIQVGSLAPAPVPLVAHSDVWAFHKGTNAPAPGWQTNADNTLDATWARGAGPFGYAVDNASEVALVQTPLPDMQDRYSTFYIRRSFEVTNAPDPSQPLSLVMDWDDGFVAWLDGVELAPRMNAPGAAGTEPAVTATATASHESSRGNNVPQPVAWFSLGLAADRLTSGTHVLAILGLNQAANSSDFLLSADLLAEPNHPSDSIHGALLAIVPTNSVLLSGTNTIPNSTRVLVNGAEAAFDPGNGEWSRTVPLSPGFNRFLLQALTGEGVQLFATNQDVVGDFPSVAIGGMLGPDTALTSSMGVFHVTNALVVPAGGSLSIGPGCVFLISPGANFLVTNATLTMAGTETAPVYFAPADGTTAWGGIIASGANCKVVAQHVGTAAGHLELFDGAQATFEDSYWHDYTVSSPPVIHTLGQPNHCALTLRRCHVSRYYEILCQLSLNQFEDCLMEYQSPGGDGIDFDGGQPGSVLRNCTVRHGKYTNIDALDMGEFGGTGEPSRGILIEGCRLYDFVDKGVSMGVRVDAVVTNCLLHNLDAGISVKDLSTAGIYNCTIVSNNHGFNCYNKANPASSSGGGFITNSFNNILWNNAEAVSLANGSTLTASYCDLQNTNFPGLGNLNLDPVWVNPAGFDFRLGPGSPLLTTGKDGASMGARFPVGAEMAPSHPVLGSVERLGNAVTLRFWADSERSYSVLANDSLSGGTWAKVTDVFPTPLPRKAVVTDTAVPGSARFYRLVTPRLP
jgi:hypothetical protein